MKKKALVLLVFVILLSTFAMMTACTEDPNELAGNYYKTEVEGDDTVYTLLTLKEDKSFSLATFRSATVNVPKNDISEYFAGLTAESTLYGEYEGNDVTLQLTYSGGDNDGKTVKVKLNMSSGKYDVKTSFGTGVIYSLIGVSITFVVLAFLMLVIRLISYGYSVAKTIKAKKALEKGEEVLALPQYAEGSVGQIAVYDNISDKELAMIMAITADTLNEPINTLRFISVKEIKQDIEETK